MIVKIVLVGDSGTGKTNILMNYINNSFYSNSKSTVGVDFYSKSLNIKGNLIKFDIWDSSGQERYKSITTVYYKDAKGFLIVYDITSKTSFDNIEKWIDEILKVVQNPIIILIGNKIDLNEGRTVSIEEALQKAEKYNCDFYEVSALDGKNIDFIFINLVYKILKKIEKIEKDLQKESNNKNIKCSLKKHKELEAIKYCQNCKIYMCNKCIKNHSELFEDHLVLNDLKKELNNYDIMFKEILPGEEIISILFSSNDHRLLYSLPCKNTTPFSKIEEKFFEEFPEYKETNYYFLANGNKVKKFKTVEENHIYNGMPVIFVKE